MSCLKNPIGLFDSGAGGLFVLNNLQQYYPLEDFVFLADTANFPYGEKSPEVIRQLALNCANTLIEKGCKAIVIACNTAAAYALDLLKERMGVPVIGPIEAAAKEAARVTKNGKIGVLATRATVKSGIYQTLLKEYNTHVLESPLLANLVQENQIDLLENALRQYVMPLLDLGIDTLVLGCTHYPYVEQFLKPYPLRIVDSARCFIPQVADVLRGHVEYLVTGEPLLFPTVAPQKSLLIEPTLLPR